MCVLNEAEAIKMEEFQFYQDRSRKWCWKHVDKSGSEIAHSADCFATLAECVNDARHNGYLTGKISWRRKAAPRVGVAVLQRRRGSGMRLQRNA
jgi:hypothetical protein